MSIASVRPPNALTLQPAPFACLSAMDVLLRPFLMGQRARFARAATVAIALPGAGAARRVIGKYGTRRLRCFLLGKGSTMAISPPHLASGRGFTNEVGTYLWMLDHLAAAFLGACLAAARRFRALGRIDLAVVALRVLGVERPQLKRLVRVRPTRHGSG
jgi:hypothetical protein